MSRPEDVHPDIRAVACDLTVPSMRSVVPGPGLRAKVPADKLGDTEVFHSLYLPMDWRPDQRYPVLVEYAGNGPYANE